MSEPGKCLVTNYSAWLQDITLRGFFLIDCTWIQIFDAVKTGDDFNSDTFGGILLYNIYYMNHT